MQLAVVVEVIVQRHGTLIVAHQPGRPVHLIEPVCHLLGVTHRRRETDQLHVRRAPNEHFLPHDAALLVGQEVDLVDDHVADVAQLVAADHEQVAQDLGGHHQQGCLAVDHCVAGGDAHVRRVVLSHELAILLVRERLDRGRVDELAAGGHGAECREVRDERLAGPRRGCHEHGFALCKG